MATEAGKTPSPVDAEMAKYRELQEGAYETCGSGYPRWFRKAVHETGSEIGRINVEGSQRRAHLHAELIVLSMHGEQFELELRRAISDDQI